MFGDDLSFQFNLLTEGVFLDEVCLFTKIQDAFINLKNGKYNYAIDIIHGSKSFVNFENHSSLVSSLKTGSKIKRKLSDMMFIVFSKSNVD